MPPECLEGPIDIGVAEADGIRSFGSELTMQHREMTGNVTGQFMSSILADILG